MLGAASRRDAERLIAAGRVHVDGQRVGDPAFLVYPDRVTISLDGKAVEPRGRLRYVALHKPPGVVSTVRDPHAGRTVTALVPGEVRLYPVGRLDKDSEGLILLTNDGDFANVVAHPRYGVEKEYRALLRNRPSREALDHLRRGVTIDGELARPVTVDVERQARDGAWVRLVLREGRKREVRRMLEAVHHPVLRLIRTRIGPIRLGNLPSGAHRELSEWEVRRLLAGARPERKRSARTREAPADGTNAEAAAQSVASVARDDPEAGANARLNTLPDGDGAITPLIVAIDGPAGAGKTTVGARLAERLGATFVDTGIFYRVLTLLALERDLDFGDATALAAIARDLQVRLAPPGAEGPSGDVLVGGRTLGAELRTPEVDAHVSVVAGHGAVREALIEPQRRAVAGGRAVVVGRDIGTVICPDADLKVYLEATPDERARRRVLQLGHALPLDQVRASVDRRDELDRTRTVAPLEAAPDAIVLATDGVPVEAVVERIHRLLQGRDAAGG
jgi:cytidylate kinase